MSASLFRIHGLSNYPSHFLDNDHILIESGSILSCLNTINGQQNHVLSLTEFDSISCIATNPAQQIFVVAIQSGTSSRIELYRFVDEDTGLLHIFEEEECSAVGYSHIDISHDGKYMMAISNIPDLQIEFWSISESKCSKLASNHMQYDDIKYVAFSPTSNELFMSANNNTIILWRVYFKFDQYFLTSTIHSVNASKPTPKRPMTQIQCITFGEAGTDIIYCNNRGEMIIFDENTASIEENDPNQLIKHTFDTQQNISKVIFTRFYYIAVFAEEGIIEFISKQNLQKLYQHRIDSPIKHCICTPNYEQFLIINKSNEFLNCFMHKTLLSNDISNMQQDANLIKIDKICTLTQILPNEGVNIVSLNNDRILVQSGDSQSLQVIQFHDVEDTNDDEAITVNGIPIVNVSTIEIFHYQNTTDLIALGFNNGHFGLCCAIDSATNMKIFFAERLFEDNVKQIQFDKSGTFIACISNNDNKIWFIQLIENTTPKILGYYQLNSVPICCSWIYDAYDTLKIIIAFDNGFVATYDAPANNNETTLRLESFSVDCEVDFTLQKIICDPNQTAPDRLLCLTEDHKLRAFLLDDDATVFPDDTFIFDDHMKQMTDIRVNVESDLLLTTSNDGMIIIRSLSYPEDILLFVYAHNAHVGGVLRAQFFQSASKILSFGYDGSVISWQLDLDLDVQYYDDEDRIQCPLNTQYLSGLQEITVDEYQAHAILKYEEKIKHQIMDKEKEKYEPTLRVIENELNELREQYVGIVDKVQNASDLERLKDDELIVDNAEYDLLINENKKEIENMAESIKYENTGKQLIARRIREQCWDKMSDKLQMLNGIKNNKVAVCTFPILSHESNDLQLQKKIQFLRKMNIMEQKWSTKTQDRVRVEFDAKHSVNDGSIKYIWDINEESKEERKMNKKESSSADKDGDKKDDTKKKQKKKDNEKKGKDSNKQDIGVKCSVSSALKKLLFHPLELYTNYRKRIEIHLLNLRIRETKSTFNQQVEKLFKLKKNEIERINEMSLEIRDIEKELELQTDGVFICKLDANEDKERIFRVTDDEIEVEKVLNMQQLEELKQQEMERKNREKSTNNDATERALDEMMNNTLDSKDEVERLEDTLKKPDFMDKIEESKYSEQQRAQVAKYLAKKEALTKAKEVRQKLLRTRLKSLKNDVTDICKVFDQKLCALYDTSLNVMEDIYVHELMLIHLTNDIVEYEEYCKRIHNMNAELIRLKQDKKKADNTYNQFNNKLEESTKKLNELQAYDKYLEKTFKKEMVALCSNDVYFDYLFKLFRGKKAMLPNDSGADLLSINNHKRSSKNIRKSTSNTTVATNDTRDDINEEAIDTKPDLNPYLNSKQTESTSKQQVLCPPDLSVNVWKRFLELREMKISKDEEIKQLSEQIASMEAEVNALKSNQMIIVESMEEIEKGKELIICRRNEYKLDCELFFCISQGSIEVDESPVVTDMKQSVMCHRNVIENLNNIILDAGTQQIERLNEIKKFRRGINSLNWRAKLLDLQHRYYTLLTTEYQLRRVTKKDQEVLKAGGHSNKQKHEVVSLEKKLQFTKNTMHQKIKDKKVIFKKYKVRIDDIKKSNEDLIQEIHKLNNDVSAKQQIMDIRANGRGTTMKQEKKYANKKKMDAVVTRRKLVDLVQAQSNEIEMLRNELDRLRRSTFPSFSIHQTN